MSQAFSLPNNTLPASSRAGGLGIQQKTVTSNPAKPPIRTNQFLQQTFLQQSSINQRIKARLNRNTPPAINPANHKTATNNQIQPNFSNQNTQIYNNNINNPNNKTATLNNRQIITNQHSFKVSPEHQRHLEALKMVKNQEQEMLAEYERESVSENYYNKNLIIGLVSIGFYYLGVILITFFRNIDGQAVVTLEANETSWQLLFSDFGTFLSNFFRNIFGYFIQYGKLFGYFPEYGRLNVEPVPRHLMPVDIFLKGATILYFHFFWMKWDTKKSLEKGYINSNYPYQETSNTSPNIQQQTKTEKADLDTQPENLDPKEFVEGLFANENQNPTLTSNYQTNQNDEDEDDEATDNSSMPFSGVHKPIEEFYHENEDKIYGIIRREILPGSNLIIALYFSARSVLSLNNPLEILLYVLGIMSMFWCMQSFLLVLDHNQYPPEEEN
jgi:hypothetical protein